MESNLGMIFWSKLAKSLMCCPALEISRIQDQCWISLSVNSRKYVAMYLAILVAR